MAKKETSKRIASKAAKRLRDRGAPKDTKSIAGSALSQAPDKRRKKS